MVRASPERSAWSRALLWACAAKILVLILVFEPRGLIAFDLPKALAGRALEWIVAALLAVVVLEHGRSILPRTRLHLAVAALGGAWVLSALFAQDRYLAVFGEEDRYLGLTYLVDMVVLYLGCAVAVRDEHDARTLLGTIGAAGAVAIAYAWAQRAGLDPWVWQDDPRVRPFATFGQPDHFGHLLSVLFGLALGWLVSARRGAAAAIASASIVVLLATSAIVATRGTLLGLAAAATAAAWVLRGRPRALAALALGTAVAAAALAVSPLGQRTIATLSGQALVDRVVIYRAGWSAFVSRPLLGYGPDSFRAAYAQHRTVDSLPITGAGPQTSAHDWLLDAATGLGAVGAVATIAFVAIGTGALVALARERRGVGAPLLLAWCAYWAHALVAAGAVGVMWLPWVAAGIAAGLGPRSSFARARRIRWLAAPLLVAAAIGALTGARAYLADRDARAVEDAFALQDPASALTAAENAVARDPGRAAHWNRLGLALDATGDRRGAAEAYAEAARRLPSEAVYSANEARSLARLALAGAPVADDAIAAARRAVAADPNAPVGHVVLAEIAIAFGRCEIARTEAERASALGRPELVARAAACR